MLVRDEVDWFDDRRPLGRLDDTTLAEARFRAAIAEPSMAA